MAINYLILLSRQGKVVSLDIWFFLVNNLESHN